MVLATPAFIIPSAITMDTEVVTATIATDLGRPREVLMATNTEGHGDSLALLINFILLIASVHLKLK